MYTNQGSQVLLLVCTDTAPGQIQKGKVGDSPGGPVAKIPCYQCRGPRFDLWSRNKIPHATTSSLHATTKKKKKKQTKPCMLQLKIPTCHNKDWRSCLPQLRPVAAHITLASKTSLYRPFQQQRERRRSNDANDNAPSTFLHAWAGQWPRKMKLHPLQAHPLAVLNVQVHMVAFRNWRAEQHEQWVKHLCSRINFRQIKVRCFRQENTAFIFLVC